MARMNRIGRYARATAVSGTAPGQTLRVSYHSTVVVERDSDGWVTLNSGGYRTATTKARMNQTANQFGLGFSVFAKDFDWFVKVGDRVKSFSDGMTFRDEHEGAGYAQL